MIVTEIKDLTAKKVKVILEDDYSFPLYKSELKKLKIEQGIDLTDDALDHIKNDILYTTALNRSLYLIKAKEYSKKEIAQKLGSGDYPEDIINSVIDELIKMRFIDDKRYTQEYIAYHTMNKSRQAITSALMLKGIDKNTIDEAFDIYMDENPDYEKKLCLDLLERKYLRQKDDADYITVNKAKKYLAGRGFSFDAADCATKEFFDI